MGQTLAIALTLALALALTLTLALNLVGLEATMDQMTPDFRKKTALGLKGVLKACGIRVREEEGGRGGHAEPLLGMHPSPHRMAKPSSPPPPLVAGPGEDAGLCQVGLPGLLRGPVKGAC